MTDSSPIPPPTTPHVRPATPNDAAAIRALTREAYAKWVPVIGREPKPMMADYDAAVRNHRIDLLHMDATLAALIEMIPADDHLLIENIAVSPRFQRRGLGRMLLAHAEQVAVSLGHTVVRLYTSKAFADNVRLYQSVGYAIDAEEPFMGGTTVYMSRPVRAAIPGGPGGARPDRRDL
jgi:GNAT superfamily N-acetyltransferase